MRQSTLRLQRERAASAARRQREGPGRVARLRLHAPSRWCARFSRAGVPVLKRPSVKPSARRARESPRAASSPSRPPTSFSSPTCISAWRKVPVVSITARACSLARRPRAARPAPAPPSTTSAATSPSCDGEVRLADEGGLHRARVGVAIAEHAGRAHRRALGGVEGLEVGAGEVGRARHLAAQRVELAHQVALGGAADRRVAAHHRGAVRLAG